MAPRFGISRNTGTVVQFLLRLLLIVLTVSVVLMVASTAYVVVSRYKRGKVEDEEWDGPEFVRDDQVVQISEKARSQWAPSLTEETAESRRSVFAPDSDHRPASVGMISMLDADTDALVRLLAGVEWPCGLEELPGAEPDRVAYVTTEATSREVGLRVGEELRRLGLDVEAVQHHEARIWRDGLELLMTLYENPRRVIRDRRVAFPTAPREAVVVEFSLE